VVCDDDDVDAGIGVTVAVTCSVVATVWIIVTGAAVVPCDG
jgi:hypothetical protein